MSWVKAGKAAWDWWSDPHPAPPAGPGMSMESVKRFIDFAAESGFPYMLLDEGWSYRPVYDPTNLSNADILRTRRISICRRWSTMPRQGLSDCLLWVQWDLLDKKLPEAFALYASWGIKGVEDRLHGAQRPGHGRLLSPGDGGGRPAPAVDRHALGLSTHGLEPHLPELHYAGRRDGRRI